MNNVNFHGYAFEGPFSDLDNIKDISGVYIVIWHWVPDIRGYGMLDCGESSKLRSRLEDHERRDCWLRKSYGNIAYCVRYCDEKERLEIENEIRSKDKDIPCGDK